MALYLVLYDRYDTIQLYPNAWLGRDVDRIGAITTTEEIGGLCDECRVNGKEVFVHRCA